MTDLDRQKARLRRIADRRDYPGEASERQIGWNSHAEMVDYHHLQWALDQCGMLKRSVKLKKEQGD